MLEESLHSLYRYIKQEEYSEACRSGGYPELEWHELGTVMRVVFYPHPDVSAIFLD